MSKTLEQILNYRVVTGVVRDKAGGVPSDLLPPQFLTANRSVDTRQVSVDVVESSRQTAKLVGPGSPAASRGLQKVESRSFTIPRFAEEITIEGDTLLHLRGLGTSNQQDRGASYVDFQLAEKARRFTNTRTAMIFSLLKHGAMYFANDGNGAFDLLPTSSGADLTIDLQVPSGNKTSLGGILTDWSATSTDIVEEIQGGLELARKTAGLPIRHVFYGPNVRKYVAQNDLSQAFINGDPTLAQQLRMGSIPNGFGDMGLTWHPLRSAFFEDADGTNQDLFTGDEVIFTPDPSPEWYELIEGGEPVVDSIDVTSIEDATNNMTVVNGMGAYAYWKQNPASMSCITFDNVLPALRIPSAIFIGDCTN